MAGPPTARSIDRRRSLQPCDYLVRPDLFGEAANAEVTLPPGGDVASMEIAQMIHIVVATWRHAPGTPSGAEFGRRFGLSRQT